MTSAVHHPPPANNLAQALTPACRCRYATVLCAHPCYSPASAPATPADPLHRRCGRCNRTASLDASLWPCKKFNIEFRPRSFSELASPLLTCIILMYHPYKGAATRYMSGSYFCVLPTYTIKNRAKQLRIVYSIPNLYKHYYCSYYAALNIWTMQYPVPIT